jgi:putative membrane protein
MADVDDPTPAREAPGPARFPASVYRVGAEPDPRFSLANERTFLAWVRTALAMLAAGVALEALDVPVSAPLRMVAAALFVMLGVVGTVQAWFGWSRTERALRLGRPLPGPSMALLVAAGAVVAMLLLVIGYSG